MGLEQGPAWTIDAGSPELLLGAGAGGWHFQNRIGDEHGCGRSLDPIFAALQVDALVLQAAELGGLSVDMA